MRRAALAGNTRRLRWGDAAPDPFFVFIFLLLRCAGPDPLIRWQSEVVFLSAHAVLKDVVFRYVLSSSTTRPRGAKWDAGHRRFFPEAWKRQHRSDTERGGSETPTLDFLFFFWPLMYPPKKIRKAHMADTAAAVVELTEVSELCFQDLFEASAALATHLSRSTQVGARPTGQLAIWSAAPSAIWPRKSRFGCRAHGSIDKLAELHLDAARSAVGCVSCMHVHLRRSNSRLQTSSHRVCSAVTASSQHFRPSLPLAAAVLLG